MTELERALLALGNELDFPPERDLRAAVRARIERRRRRVLALAFAAAVVVVAFGIAMAVPQARSAILRFFHIGAVTIEQVDTLPAAEERPLAAGLGPPLTRREAEALALIPIVLPPDERPSRYYARSGVIATFLRVDSKPILLVEFTGDRVGAAKKFASPRTRVEEVEVDGGFGLWIEGGKHVLQWEFGARRLAGNVLIWLDGDRTFRLEGELDKARMLELARDITR
jgi:hypothetical protein